MHSHSFYRPQTNNGSNFLNDLHRKRIKPISIHGNDCWRQFEPRHEKTCFAICEQQRRRSDCASALSDQRLCFLCLDSVIPLLAIAKISSLYLVTVAEQAGLSLTWSQTPKTDFLVTKLLYWLLTEAIDWDNSKTLLHKWAASWQDQRSCMCAQQRLRPAWASAQSDQRLRCPREGSWGP